MAGLWEWAGDQKKKIQVLPYEIIALYGLGKKEKKTQPKPLGANKGVATMESIKSP